VLTYGSKACHIFIPSFIEEISGIAKLAPGLNDRPAIYGQFHQRYTSSFYACRSRKHEKTDKLSVFFELLGSARVKAAGRTLMKLTPGVHGTRTLLLPMLIVS